MDAEGMLWVAHWDGWRVNRSKPVTGQLLATIRVPVARVSSCAFGGPIFGPALHQEQPGPAKAEHRPNRAPVGCSWPSPACAAYRPLSTRADGNWSRWRSCYVSAMQLPTGVLDNATCSEHPLLETGRVLKFVFCSSLLR